MSKRIALALAMVLALAPLGAPARAACGIEAHTPILDTSKAMKNNLDLCISSVDGTHVPHGETFSFLDVTGPKTVNRGYVDAVNGRGAKVVGGGISHVATTLYLAVKQLSPELKVTEKHVFSKFTGGYVKSKDDAIAVDYNDGLDLRFKNNWQDLTIYMWRDGDDMYCEIEAGSGGSDFAFDCDEYGRDPYGDGEADAPGDYLERCGRGVPEFSYSALSATLNQRMATRTGPNTKYTEPGTFPQGTEIEVFYQTEGNGVQWGMVEFESGGKMYRLYTGMKRIDAPRVPKDSEDYRELELAGDVTPRYGPGREYAQQSDVLPGGEMVKVYFKESGYCMVDYEGYTQAVRGWVPMEMLRW